MIPANVIEEVRKAVDAVAVIGERVELRKGGTSFVGCCPFHEEKEGSFRVYPNDKRFVCFGCGARGDVFEFLQRFDAKPFPTVVRELAAKVGVVVPESAPSPGEERARAERGALLAACEVAANHWQKHLWGPEGEPGRLYLAGRGIREDVARAFRLGYALDEWHDLERSLARARIPVAVRQAAGLLGAKEEPGKPPRYYDRFRHRIIFPIEDAEGRALAFGARAIGSEPGAKYLNGPETAIYRKGRALYGLHQARDAIRRTGRAILVEGYFDVLTLHQAGAAGAVAACGTAVGPDQVALLTASGCRELVLLFDGDEAGSRAPARAAPALFAAGLATSVARLPEAPAGQSDPDTFLRRLGKDAVQEILAGAKTLSDFLIDDATRRHAGGLGAQAPVEHKLRVVRELTPLVLAAPEGLPRSTFEKTIARRLDLDIGPLRHEVHRSSGRVPAQARG